MDINVLRSIVTVLSFLSFLGICWWAWSHRNRERFIEAARLPLHEDDSVQAHRQDAGNPGQANRIAGQTAAMTEMTENRTCNEGKQS